MKIRFLRHAVLTIFVLWVLFVLSIWGLQRFIVFQGKSLPDDYTFQFSAPFEEHFLDSPDQLRINALYFPTQLERKGAILYFHGNADNLQRWGRYQGDFTSRGYDVFMIDYRSYGKSEGKADEASCYRDARLAYDWLLQKFPSTDVIIYGRSLGASIASELATHVPARMLVLETPFDRLRNTLPGSVPSLFYPFDLKYHFANDRHLSKVNYPVHIFHGTKDLVVPLRSAQALEAYLQVGDSFTLIPGGGHKNLSTFSEFQEGLDTLLGTTTSTF